MGLGFLPGGIKSSLHFPAPVPNLIEEKNRERTGAEYIYGNI